MKYLAWIKRFFSPMRAFQASHEDQVEPWPHKGQTRFLEPNGTIREDHFLFDDIDQFRTEDALGRPLQTTGRKNS